MDPDKFFRLVLERGPRVKRPCDHCQDPVTGQHFEYYIIGYGTRREHWAKKCLNCMKKIQVFPRRAK